MAQFEVAIEGSKEVFNSFEKALNRLEELLAERHWEATLRMITDSTVFYYNRRAGVFFTF